jgi:hypothetical protein
MQDFLLSISRVRRRLTELSLTDWQALARFGLFSLFVSMQLSLQPLPRVVAGLARRASHGNWLGLRNIILTYKIQRLVRLVNLATRFSPGSGYCLVRSLLLFWVLCVRGENVNLCLGVRKEQATLQGHAWLETTSGKFAEPVGVAEQFVTVQRFASPHYL